MVSASGTLDPRCRPTVSSRLSAIARGVANRLAAFDRAVRAADEYERLSRLSDGQLSARGLSRQTLPHHVFAKHMNR